MRRDQPYFIIAFRFKFSILRSRTLPRLIFLSFFFFSFFFLADRAKPNTPRQVRDSKRQSHTYMITWQISDLTIPIHAESCYIEILLLILLPLSGGNGNPTSGYEANERSAADHATRPDHTCTRRSLHALLRMICGRGPVTHSCSALSLHASISMLISRCFIVCFVVFESVCACMCDDCIDVCFESDRLPAKKDFTRWKPVQLASETYDNTPHSPCSSTSKLLEDHRCFFCQALRSRRSWWSSDLFQ